MCSVVPECGPGGEALSGLAGLVRTAVPVDPIVMAGRGVGQDSPVSRVVVVTCSKPGSVNSHELDLHIGNFPRRTWRLDMKAVAVRIAVGGQLRGAVLLHVVLGTEVVSNLVTEGVVASSAALGQATLSTTSIVNREGELLNK